MNDFFEPTLFENISNKIEFSFEFFPPKTEKMDITLQDTVHSLAPLGPRFVSVTCGAGGSTRARTHATLAGIMRKTSIPAAAHLTCIGVDRHETRDIARAYWDAGIRHIVALRGDPPGTGERYCPHPHGFANAAALTAGLKAIAPFEISVAAYPECHPESASIQVDFDNLKAKIDAGADRAITQFFFSSETFLRFRDKAFAAGIKTEIVPGILPVANITQTRKFAALCRAEIPLWMNRTFDELDDNPDQHQRLATMLATRMCKELYAGGVRHFHFYTLNRAELSYAVCHQLRNQLCI